MSENAVCSDKKEMWLKGYKIICSVYVMLLLSTNGWPAPLPLLQTEYGAFNCVVTET